MEIVKNQIIEQIINQWYLIPKRSKVLAGLQDALDDGHRVCQRLHLLQ